MHAIKICPAVTLLSYLVAAAAPPAPTPLSPAAGASVLEPFTISWSAVTDPSGIIAYNWQVSPSSSFTPVILLNSTNGATQDTVSGLANGTYFWRVQAVSGAFVQGAWSQPRSFTVTGVSAGAPASPTLGPPKGYSTFHPMEVMTFNWSAVPGAASYLLQFSIDPSFPVATRGQFDNIPNTTFSFAIGDSDPGNYSMRVFAVNANGILSQPSNVIKFSVLFDNPLPPPPAPVSPANGATVSLPVTLTWTDVPNPQPSGYEIQIARDSGFSSIEEDDPQLNGPSRTVLSLTAGTKFWRVRSAQGDSSPTTAAVTAWSSAASFTIPSTPPTPVSVTVVNNPLFSGDTTWVQIQLSAAVGPSGATINLSSSNPSAAPVPATVAMPPNTAWTQFQMQAGQVTTPTPITITASLNSGSASTQVTLQPPSLKSLTISPTTITGGAQPGLFVFLNGQAPAGGAVVSLASDSPAVSPPPTIAVPAGSPSASINLQTSAVTANTVATITATWNGLSAQAKVTLTPGQAPASLTLSPASTTGSNGSFATVTVAAASSTDTSMQVASSNPSVASVPNSMIIPAGATTGGFNIFTSIVTTQTLVTISVSGGGVTKTATLTVNPSSPVLSAISLSPSTVTGGGASQGTVTLTSAAPAGGAAVSLSSSNTAAATVPASVTVPAGATSATFSVSTAPVSASTSVTITGSFGGASRSAVLTVSPAAAASASLSSVSVSPASVTGGTASQGTVTLTSAAPAGGFTVAMSSSAAAATVPATVTVAQGATSATFAISTSSVAASTAVTITASAGGLSRTATLTVTPPGQAATLTVTASGRTGETVSSTPAGIRVAVGSTGSASFTTGTSITLSVSNGRTAVWSGACSSGGKDTQTCTFTLTGNASVTGNVK